MGSLGLGACLADDMGLGKTMQLLAFLLRRKTRPRATRDRRCSSLRPRWSETGNARSSASRRPSTWSVTTAPRAKSASDLPKARHAGRHDLWPPAPRRRAPWGVDWSVAALDEAQNIKNASSATARAARALRAPHRFALTGTPVENRLAELWSILEFANPGLLGPLEAFRRDFALPIERYGDDDAAARLRRIVGPFILRRTKSDPTIIADLPPKNEMKVVCTLTREQATLYKAVVDEELRRIESADGIERRGRVLALLTFTKQICNHPAQYLGETGPLPKRSGKLARTTEMLEEAVAAGDKALVFTQFREMGDKLVDHLRANLGCEVVFLHGGTPKKARDEMVRRFQDEPHGPRIFVLSIKAGGTGLNLTAANHVFHFDRWWNPAVEDQATDRAYRIGQRRAVQVHKLVCAGTVEEKIDRLLDQKRDLARRSSAPASSGSPSSTAASCAPSSRCPRAPWRTVRTTTTPRIRTGETAREGPLRARPRRGAPDEPLRLVPVRAEEATAGAWHPHREARHHVVGPALDRGARGRPGRRRRAARARADLRTRRAHARPRRQGRQGHGQGHGLATHAVPDHDRAHRAERARPGRRRSTAWPRRRSSRPSCSPGRCRRPSTRSSWRPA
jgi:hypothetical protein